MPTELENVIFYHVPKTGGTSISQMMVRAGGKKLSKLDGNILAKHPLNLAKEHTSPLYYESPLKSFAVFREPADWYKSIWAYRVKSGWPDAHVYPIDELRNDDFNEFVKSVMTKYPKGFLSAIYSEFESVDVKFKYEKTFNRIIKFIEDECGVTLKPVKANVSDPLLKKRASYRVGVRQMVERNEKEAYRIWEKL